MAISPEVSSQFNYFISSLELDEVIIPETLLLTAQPQVSFYLQRPELDKNLEPVILEMVDKIIFALGKSKSQIHVEFVDQAPETSSLRGSVILFAESHWVSPGFVYEEIMDSDTGLRLKLPPFHEMIKKPDLKKIAWFKIKDFVARCG